MATLDAFTSRLGSSQGRIRLGEDEWDFVLGDSTPGYFYELNPGDHAEVAQGTNLDNVDLIRTELTLRVPDDVPLGWYWEASIVVDGIKRARATCRPGLTREITDLAANVSKMSGLHKLGVRLELRAL